MSSIRMIASRKGVFGVISGHAESPPTPTPRPLSYTPETLMPLRLVASQNWGREEKEEENFGQMETKKAVTQRAQKDRGEAERKQRQTGGDEGR